MGAVLTVTSGPGMLGTTIAIRDAASVSLVREAVRACGAKAGLATLAIESLVAAASELGHNQLAHAEGGSVAVVDVEREGVRGVEVIASDRGRGIADPTTALRGLPHDGTLGSSLGVGLSAVGRQADEVDVDVRVGAGTTVRARTFAARVPRSEYGVFARPHPDEITIGDHATAIRTATSLELAVADGLGHGPAAREAADRAIADFARIPGRPLDQCLRDAHVAAAGTRGLVMDVARLAFAGRSVEHAGIGNITSRVLASNGDVRVFASATGTVGGTLPRRIPVERAVLSAFDVVVMVSDGIVSRVDLAGALARAHPIVIAQYIVETFSRGHDDALVLVAR